MVSGSVMLGGSGEPILRADAVREGRGGDHHLERRTRRVGLRHRPVEHRLVRVGVEFVPGGARGGTVVPGQPVRVVARRAHHRQDLAGARFDRDDRTGVALGGQFVVGDLLHDRVDRADDVAATRVASRHQVEEATPEQAGGIRPVEDGILGPFQAGAAVLHRVEAGDRCVRERTHRLLGRGRVGPQVLVAAVGGHRDGQHLSARGDLPALAGVLVDQHPRVARIGAQVVGLDDLHVRGIGEESGNHEHHGHRDLAEWTVHSRPIISVCASAIGGAGLLRGGRTGSRAECEIFISRASSR